jgi:Kef-type K+ transport system membrane component KefB
VALFATIFFVLIGTGMDLSVLNPFDPANRAGLMVAAFLLAVAIAGKVAAGWSSSQQQPTNRLVVGLGTMPRGEVGLIFLGLGTQAHLLSPALEAAILLMVIGTTFLAPVLLETGAGSGKTDGPDLDPPRRNPHLRAVPLHSPAGASAGAAGSTTAMASGGCWPSCC